MRHGHGRALVDSFIVIKLNTAVCMKCGSTYSGPKDYVECKGCGETLSSTGQHAEKKVPIGTWVIATQKPKVSP